jgi:ISXO2-like transposase domain
MQYTAVIEEYPRNLIELEAVFSTVAGSTVHTDGWLGYLPLKSREYQHEVTYLKGNTKTASELLPRVHLVISHLKRWMMGTHQRGDHP